MRRHRLFSFRVIAVSLCLLGFLGARVASADPPTIDPTGFGLAFINSGESPRAPQRVRRGVEAGARMDRFPLYWNSVEITPGQFDWSRIDRAVRENESQGLGTLLVLLGTAAHYYPDSVPPLTPQAPLPGGIPVEANFATLSDRQTCTEGMRPPIALYEPIYADSSDIPAPGKSINPANPWARFVHEAVEHYRPGGTAGLNVRHWEIWNEPDLCMFWTGTPREYARLLKVAYLVIKQADPEAMVIWGGLTHYGNSDFLGALVHTLKNDPMAEEYNGFFDAAASHNYSDVTKGMTYTQRIRDALAGTGWEDKPIWITESGVPACGDEIGPPCPDPHRANEEGQAAYIWQNIAYTRLAGGGPIFHFQLHDDCGNDQKSAPPADAFGLVTNESGAFCVPHEAQPRLAYNAYRLAAEYFPQTELLWDDEDGGVRRVAFFHPATGERRLLLWATGTTDAVTRVLATGIQARRLAMDGSYQDLEPVNGEYELRLPGSTNPRQANSATYIGGRPYLLIEQDTIPPQTELTVERREGAEFDLHWKSSDNLGSGVADDGVDLWIQVDAGEWQLWLSGLPPVGSTGGLGATGHSYRFAAVSRDRAGNTHPRGPAQAELNLAESRYRIFIPLTRR